MYFLRFHPHTRYYQFTFFILIIVILAAIRLILSHRLLWYLYQINFSIRDGDSVLDIYDNCMNMPNAEQSDIDGDNIGKISLSLPAWFHQPFKKNHMDHSVLY